MAQNDWVMQSRSKQKPGASQGGVIHYREVFCLKNEELMPHSHSSVCRALGRKIS